MFTFSLWLGAGFISWLIFCSFYEWTLHRFVMHRPLGKWRYPFETHAVVHHQTFKGDHTYHLINESDKETIPMAWWNGPMIIFVGILPMLAIAWATGVWPLAYGALAAIISYYGVYEYIHWCMHLPKGRRVERAGLFFRLNGHHILHHRYMHKNFNVVLPVADLCLGTLLKRSKIRFAQPRGASVPDLQPLNDEQPGHPVAAEAVSPVVSGRTA